MTWVRLDDGFDDNPKVESVSLAAAGLYVKCLAWAARKETRGAVPHAIARQKARGDEALITELVAAKLWQARADGYAPRDFAQYNPPLAEIAARRAAIAEKRRAAGLKSGEVRRAKAAAARAAQPAPPREQNEQTPNKVFGTKTDVCSDFCSFSDEHNANDGAELRTPAEQKTNPVSRSKKEEGIAGGGGGSTETLRTAAPGGAQPPPPPPHRARLEAQAILEAMRERSGGRLGRMGSAPALAALVELAATTEPRPLTLDDFRLLGAAWAAEKALTWFKRPPDIAQLVAEGGARLLQGLSEAWEWDDARRAAAAAAPASEPEPEEPAGPGMSPEELASQFGSFRAHRRAAGGDHE